MNTLTTLDNKTKRLKFLHDVLDYLKQYPLKDGVAETNREAFRSFFTDRGYLPILKKKASKTEKYGYSALSAQLLTRVNNVSLSSRFAHVAKKAGMEPFSISANRGGIYQILDLSKTIETRTEKLLASSSRRVTVIENQDEKLQETAKTIGWDEKRVERIASAGQTTKLKHVNILRAMKQIGAVHSGI